MADRRQVARSRRRRADERLRRAHRFIQREYRRRLSLEEVADAAGLSRYHFLRRFQRMYHTTPREMIEQLKIRHAQRLLRSGMSCADVARAVGYEYQSHLTTRFKKSVGCSPTQWLRKSRSRGVA